MQSYFFQIQHSCHVDFTPPFVSCPRLLVRNAICRIVRLTRFSRFHPTIDTEIIIWIHGFYLQLQINMSGIQGYIRINTMDPPQCTFKIAKYLEQQQCRSRCPLDLSNQLIRELSCQCFHLGRNMMLCKVSAQATPDLQKPLHTNITITAQSITLTNPCNTAFKSRNILKC